MNPTTIHHEIAKARLHLQRAQYECKVTRADAETQIIAKLNGSYGKNAEERERQLTIALAEHDSYIRSRMNVDKAEEHLLLLEADLEVYKDARRVEEWSVREQLARAIASRAPIIAEDGDAGIDSAADEEGWSDLLSERARQRAIGEERAKIYADMNALYPS